MQVANYAILPRIAQSPCKVDNPLFLLPVDDFDLNPTRCLELLRMIRMLQIPRMFTLILGDFRSLERVVQIKYTGDFARVGNIGLRADVLRRRLHHWHKQLTYDALRKLLPPPQRINLRNMEMLEVLNFRPFPDLDSLSEILLTLPLRPLDAEYADSPVRTLSDFLGRNELTGTLIAEDGDALEAYSAYCVMELFRAPPRIVNDLWFRLRQLQGIDDINWTTVLEEAMQVFRERVAADPSLPEVVQGELRCLFESRPGREGPSWEIKRQLASAVYEPGPLVVVSDDLESGGRQRACWFWSAGSWRISMQAKTRESDDTLPKLTTPREVQFEDLTSAFLILTHDLIAVSPQQVRNEGLVPDPANIKLAMTRWELSSSDAVEVSWRGPRFNTFRDWDQFADAWAFCLRKRPSTSGGRGRTLADLASELEWLAYAWISAGTALVDQQKWLAPFDTHREPIEPSRPEWPELVVRVNDLAEILLGRTTVDLSPSRLEVGRSWLRHMALLLAPEAGLPETVAVHFTSNSDHSRLVEFWKAHSRPICQMRALAASQFIELDSPERALELIAPRELAHFQGRCVNRAARFLRRTIGPEMGEDLAMGARERKGVLSLIKQLVGGKLELHSRTTTRLRQLRRVRRLMKIIMESRDGLDQYEAEDQGERLRSLEEQIERSLEEQERGQIPMESHPVNEVANGILCPYLEIREPIRQYERKQDKAYVVSE